MNVGISPIYPSAQARRTLHPDPHSFLGSAQSGIRVYFDLSSFRVADQGLRANPQTLGVTLLAEGEESRTVRVRGSAELHA